MSQVFGKYEKIRRIAQGGMGEVFLARQTGVLDRLAILKSLRQDLAQEREFVEQFLDEARVAATLNHPNIVSIYDVGEWHGTYYIAMEYVPGEDLSKLWYAAAKAGVGLPFQVSVRVCFEAALGLDHAHKAKDVRGMPLNIVHRDVSPQNIMVRGDGVVKLVDFGIAKAANKSSRTQAGMVKGKLQYMSPEQVRGEALDGRSDQFSLGVVLWEMCTGRRLFKADTEINTLQKILQAPIPKPSDHVPGFPPELENAILKMLQRDMDRRFKHLGDVAADLKGYLDRAALSSGETTVTAFVQQILGKELEDRVKDLTPMEGTTDHNVSLPTKDRLKPAINDAPTMVLADDDIGKMPSGPEGEWAVRRTDGSVMHFGEMSTLHQWILDGQVTGDDSFSTDGRNWKKLGSAPQFTKFLEIAQAASSLPQARPVTAPRGVPQSPNLATKPLQPAATTENPDTLQLGPTAPVDKTDPMTGAFQLGDLPASQTGTWGAPEIALAVAGARQQQIDLQQTTPTTRENPPAPPGPRRSVDGRTGSRRAEAARVPTFVWLLGGIVVALATVAGGLAAFAPDLLRTLIAAPGETGEAMKALAAVKGDDPQPIDGLLKTVDAAAQADGASADTVAAAALLHLGRARIDDEIDRLAKLASDLSEPRPADAAKTDAEGHRVAAYRLATKAVALEAGSPGPRLAMAEYQAERAERPGQAELEAEADKAIAAAKPTAVAAAVEAEMELMRALVAGKATLLGTDAAALRESADKLAALDDARARSLGRVLRARVAALPSDQQKSDVEKLKLAAAGLDDGGDPRTALLATVTRLLVKKVDESTRIAAVPAVPKGPPVAVAADAGPGSGANPSDAGPTAAAPVPVPETFEGLVAKAKRAEVNGKSKEAVGYAKRALELKPGAVDALVLLGFAELDQGLPGSALQVFRQALAKDPKNCDAEMGVASSLDAQKQTEDARKAYLMYIEICPKGREVETAKNAAARLE